MIIKKKATMYRAEYDKDFSIMQELEDIRVSDSQNTDAEIKSINKEPFDEFKWHREMGEKVRIRELKELKETGKVRKYNPNR